MTEWQEWNDRVQRWAENPLNGAGPTMPWHSREYHAQMSRKPLGWFKESFWHNHTAARVHAYHYPHGAENNPALIAYTADNDKGARDIQTQIKPGRYLREHFGHLLSEKEIAFYAAMHLNYDPDKTPWDHLEVKFATTEDEIARVYLRGPHSCMARGFSEQDHPTRVYGAGDLAIAYLETDTPNPHRYDPDRTVVARTLCWPEKKVFGRVYPTPDFWREDAFKAHDESSRCQNVLSAKLRAMGFSLLLSGKGSFDGARLIRRPHVDRRLHGDLPNLFRVPYLDNNYALGSPDQDADKFFVLREAGRPTAIWSGGNTNGVALCPRRHARTCYRCGNGYDENPTPVVASVYDESTCRENYCPTCVRTYTFTCQISGDLCDEGVSSRNHRRLIRRGNSRAAVAAWRRNAPIENPPEEVAPRERVALGGASTPRAHPDPVPAPSAQTFNLTPVEIREIYRATLFAQAPRTAQNAPISNAYGPQGAPTNAFAPTRAWPTNLATPTEEEEP